MSKFTKRFRSGIAGLLFAFSTVGCVKAMEQPVDEDNSGVVVNLPQLNHQEVLPNADEGRFTKFINKVKENKGTSACVGVGVAVAVGGSVYYLCSKDKLPESMDEPEIGDVSEVSVGLDEDEEY